MGRKVRIGIDVGGTFTDAVAIDNDSYELIAKKKIPTTHKDGVAQGIVKIVQAILEENNLEAEDVVFIAHGTTQATNALLEGDVAKVGIIGLGTGLEARSARKETNIERIELSKGKFLETESEFIDTKEITNEIISAALTNLSEKGSEVIVASGAFSVDDPRHENMVKDIAVNHNLLTTVGHEISELYGLKMRTRTAVVNGSLIPKMMITADMTEEAVKKTKIKSELMIMRADGGVMNIEEVRKRPILTMLSGLAAGVAGALMYEKVTDGIFFETGGTSVDISVIKNGKVMIKYAQVGGHKTYLQSLDVRTLGIAGGTMIQIEDNKIIDVGPRSAHIAGVAYECFDEAKGLVNAKVKTISPKIGDPATYAVVEDENEVQYSLTLCGASNLLGYIPSGDYATGNIDSTRVAWQALGDYLGISAEEAAKAALYKATDKLKDVVDSLIVEYELDPEMLTLIGGGGSASVLVPVLAERYGGKMDWRTAKNAPFISTIGVALAMVRETIERSVQNPSKEDIRKIRSDVLDKIVAAGAVEESVEVMIEVDSEKNILRALATGSTEFRSRDMTAQNLTDDELLDSAKKVLKMDEVEFKGNIDRWNLFIGNVETKKLFGLIKSKRQKVAVLDRDGVARFKNDKANYFVFRKTGISAFEEFLHDNTMFSDANATIPRVFLFYKEKMLDLSGMQTAEQMLSIMQEELLYLDDDNRIIAVAYN